MENIKIAAERVGRAGNIAMLTGAGVSAESGVPTFRGDEGLWKSFRPEQLATPEAFEADPTLVWQWYNWRRQKLATLKPNLGHDAIAKLEQRARQFLLITQNVDGLHEQAGSRKVVELHGNIWKTKCLSCGKVEQNLQVPLEPLPPLCGCGGMLRPNIVWFGESLDGAVLDRAMDAVKKCQVFIVAGTSSIVQPAASLTSLAKQAGAFVVEINLDVTPASSIADVSIRGKTGELLPQIFG